MADKNIQMKQKTASGYDNIYPQTKSANITDATADATANMVVKRDPNGRAKFANPSAATDAANKQFVEGYALPKSGGDVTGVIGIDEAEGGAIFPLIDPKDATVPPSDYPDGVSMMRLSSSQAGWPNLGTDANKTVISFIAAKGSGNRILQIVSQKVNGRVAIRVGNADGSGWSDFFELAQLGQANTFTQNQTMLSSRPLFTFRPTSDSQTSAIGPFFVDQAGTNRWIAGYTPSSGNYVIYDYVKNASRVIINPDGDLMLDGNVTFRNSEIWINHGGIEKRTLFCYGGDSNGLGIALGAGGRTIIYAGEAVGQLTPNLSPTTEDAIVAADTHVYLMAGLQNGWDNRHEYAFRNDGDFRINGNSVWHRGQLRWNSGRLEYNDGGTWRAVGGVYRSYRTEFTLAASQTSFVNVINISNSSGVIPSIRCIEASGSNVEFRVTLDGTVVFQGTFTGGIGNGSAFDIARGFFTSSDSPPSIYFKTSAQISIRYVNPVSNICRLAVTYAI